MLVKAKKFNRDDTPPQVVGFIYNRRVREGQMIELQDASHFSAKWMEKLDEGEVERKKPSKQNRDSITQQNVI